MITYSTARGELTYWSTAVCKLALLDPVVSKLGGFIVPHQGWGLVPGAVLVVGVEDTLLLRGQLDSGLLLGLLHCTTFKKTLVVGARERQNDRVADGHGLGRDLSVGRDSQDGNACKEEGGELDHGAEGGVCVVLLLLMLFY